MSVTYEQDPEFSSEKIVDLYNAVGWGAYASDADGLILAIENSTFVVAARDNTDLVGLARCLSDDVSICYLQDILVRPTYQRAGVGRELFQRCLERFSRVRMFVLMTDDEPRQEAFYRSMGLENLGDSPHLRVFFRNNASSG
jgi:GNAT superfamily N-acetyltransferase